MPPRPFEIEALREIVRDAGAVGGRGGAEDGLPGGDGACVAIQAEDEW